MDLIKNVQIIVQLLFEHKNTIILIISILSIVFNLFYIILKKINGPHSIDDKYNDN